VRYDSGTSSGGQITTSLDRVQVIEFHARTTNAGSMYVGRADVSTTNGRELPPGESFTINFATPERQGSVSFDSFWLAGSDDVDWTVVLEH